VVPSNNSPSGRITGPPDHTCTWHCIWSPRDYPWHCKQSPKLCTPTRSQMDTRQLTMKQGSLLKSKLISRHEWRACTHHHLAMSICIYTSCWYSFTDWYRYAKCQLALKTQPQGQLHLCWVQLVTNTHTRRVPSWALLGTRHDSSNEQGQSIHSKGGIRYG